MDSVFVGDYRTAAEDIVLDTASVSAKGGLSLVDESDLAVCSKTRMFHQRRTVNTGRDPRTEAA